MSDAAESSELAEVRDLGDQLLTYEAQMTEYESLLKDLVTSESDTDNQG